MEEKKTWRFWLTVALAAAAALFQGLSLLVQLQHEQEHDKTDYAPMVISILVTVVAWVITAIAVIRNWRDANRSGFIETKLLNKSYEFEINTKSLNKKIEEETKRAEASIRELNEKITTNDRAYASRTAELTREYIARVAEQTQRADDNLKKWSDEVQAHQETKVRERDANTYKARAEEAAQMALGKCRAELEKVQQANIPALLIEYNAERELEYLTFINDGSPTITDIAVGPVLWDTAYRREINLHSVIGPLQSKRQIEAKFAVFEQIGMSRQLTKLPDLLRDIIQKGCNADAKVTVSYFACNSRFSQRYTLNVDPFNRVVWNPDLAIRESVATEGL